MRRLIREQAIAANKSLPLAEHLVELIGDKKEVRILDVGSGPFPTTGQYLRGVKVDIHWCDKKDPTEFWDQIGEKPTFEIESQDMELLGYDDNSFDIVQCVNALDHTRNALLAVMQMQRVVKPGGWVYIDCALDQRSAQRKKHYWDAKENGLFVGESHQFSLKTCGFDIEFIDNDLGERQYNHIIARSRLYAQYYNPEP